MSLKLKNTGREVLSLLIMLLLTVMIGAPTAGAEPDDRTVHWLTYREAMDKGRNHDLPILLHFTAQHSDVCRKMKRVTYKDRKVIRYLNQNFAVAMVDAEELPALARKFKVETLPVLWFLDADGKGLTSINGEVGPQKMLRVTRYIKQKIYEHTDYTTWRDKGAGR